MLSRTRILVPIVALVLCAGGVAPSAAGTARTASSASVSRETSLETLLIQEINTIRAEHGLHRLSRSSSLTRTAVGHSREMATIGFFTHESLNGLPFWHRVKQSYPPRSNGWTVGENLAMFGRLAPSAVDIVAAWMASPPHRANLLRSTFREAGVGIIFNPSAGGVFGGEPTWVVTLDVGRR